MLVLTPTGLRLCEAPHAIGDSDDMGAPPAWLTNIGRAILRFFRAAGPAVVQAAVQTGVRIHSDGEQDGQPPQGARRPQIVLTPEMARQWLTLFCQFGLLPRENCINVLPPQPGQMPPAQTPPAQPQNWWEKIPTPVWIALTALGVALLVRQLR